ncbi:hypothetical protein Hanom_Chr02g00121271 [Helianthus anomalus]
MEARSLTSPALKARVTAEAAVALSASYLAFRDAFILCLLIGFTYRRYVKTVCILQVDALSFSSTNIL